MSVTVRPDGMLDIDTVPGAGISYWSWVKWAQPDVLPAGTYTLSVDYDTPTGDWSSQFGATLINIPGHAPADLRAVKGTPVTFTLDTDVPDWSLQVGWWAANNGRISGLRVQLETGDTATGWTRPVDTSLEGGVTVTGPASLAGLFTSQTSGGVTLSVDGESLTLTGSTDTGVQFNSRSFVLPAGTWQASGMFDSWNTFIRLYNGTTIIIQANQRFTLDTPTTLTARIMVNKGYPTSTVTFTPTLTKTS